MKKNHLVIILLLVSNIVFSQDYVLKLFKNLNDFNDIGYSDIICTFMIDENSHVWVAGGGLGYIPSRTNQYFFDGIKWINYNNQLSTHSIISKDKNVWFGGNSLIKFDGNNWNDSTILLGGNPLTDFLIDSKGDLWSSSKSVMGAISNCVTNRNSLIKSINFGNSNWPNNTNVNKFIEDSKQNIWLCSSNGLYTYNGNTWKTYNKSNTPILSSNINNGCMDKLNNLWFASDTTIYKFDGSNWTNFSIKNILNFPIFNNYNKINSIACDSQNNIWFTDGNDIYKFNGNVIIKFTSNLYYNISNIQIDKDDNVWFLNILNNGEKKIYYLFKCKNNNISITTSGPTTFCQGNNVILTASKGSTYLWSTGEITNNISAAKIGSYTVQVTDSNGCKNTSTPIILDVKPLPIANIANSGPTTFCQGDIVTLTSSDGNSYLWSTGETSANISVSTAGSYTVQITDFNGCKNSSTPIIIDVKPLPIANIYKSGNTTFCQGDKVTLTSSVGNSYLWSTGETSDNISVSSAGSYTVQVTDYNGCKNTSTPLILDVKPLPIVNIANSGPTTFCQGDKVTLTASDGNSYLWSTGETSDNISVSNAGSYTVQVTDLNGCKNSSAPIIIYIKPLPIANISNSGLATFCQGDKVTLTASDGNSYLWSTGEISPNISVSTAGSYTVQITDLNGCKNTSLPILLKTENPIIPTINITNDSIIGCLGQKVLLVSSFSKKYKWSNGDINQSVLIDKSGEYSVIVTDINGCENISSKTIYIKLDQCNGLISPNFEKLSIYPNPVSDVVYINTGDFTNLSGSTILITNTLGQSVFTSLINQQLFTINTTQFGARGVYTLQIIDINQVVKETRKIVLQ